MEQRRFGTNGPLTSVLGLGCWSFGSGGYWGSTSQADVDAVVAAALDTGVTTFDTAEGYNEGRSEVALGHALKGRRDEALIITKVSPDHARSVDLRASCDASLARLGTDHIDLYMLHWPIGPTSIHHFTDDPELIANPPFVDDAFATLQQLRDEGKVGYLGVSNHGPQQLTEVCAAADVVVNELPYNLLSRAIEHEILPACQQASVGVLAYMGLQQGLLTGRYLSPEQVPPPQAHSRHFAQERGGKYSRHGEPGAEDLTFTTIRALEEIAREQGTDLATLAIAWIVNQPGISAALIGSHSPERFLHDVRAAELGLDADTLQRLDGVSSKLSTVLGPSADYYENRNSSRVF